MLSSVILTLPSVILSEAKDLMAIANSIPFETV